MDRDAQEEGFTMQVSPAARMALIFWQPIMKGPFQGRISATTPTGHHSTKFRHPSSQGTTLPSRQRALPAKYWKASTLMGHS